MVTETSAKRLQNSELATTHDWTRHPDTGTITVRQASCVLRCLAEKTTRHHYSEQPLAAELYPCCLVKDDRYLLKTQLVGKELTGELCVFLR